MVDKSRKPTYSIIFGYYAIMGGFAVDVSPIHDKLSILTLSAQGIQQLAHKGVIFDIADDEIKDKSKADLLAKGLVILQVTWMIFQCITRKASGYPLTALELHTLVHAGCALIMYALWFRKPLDVKRPTIISIHGFEETVALILMRSPGFGWKPYGKFERPKGFIRARSHGTLKSWPVPYASEADFLVFDPCRGIDQPNGTDGSQSQNRDTNFESFASNLPTKVSSSMPYAIRDQTIEGLQSIALGETGNTLKSPAEVSKDTMASLEAPIQAPYTPASLPISPSPKESSGIPVLPPAGIKVTKTIFTGEFSTNGIGPNAFVSGKLNRKDLMNLQPSLLQTLHPREEIKIFQQVNPGLRARLPYPSLRTETAEYYHQLDVGLSQRDLKRWELAGAALRKEVSGNSHHFDLNNSANHPYLPITQPDTDEPYLTIRQENIGWSAMMSELEDPAKFNAPHWYTPNFSAAVQAFLASLLQKNRGSELKSVFLVLILLGVIYGGIHLFIWDGVFPTEAERLLWNISAVTLLAVPMLTVLLIVIGLGYRKVEALCCPPVFKHDSPNAQRSPLDISACKRRKWGLAIRMLFCPVWYLSMYLMYAIAALYCFGRVFIVVESFISLRHVPKGVYADIGWPKYIPHL